MSDIMTVQTMYYYYNASKGIIEQYAVY